MCSRPEHTAERLGRHRGPVRVYGAPRLRRLAPLLRPTTDLWLWFITVGVVVVGRVLVFVHLLAAVGLAAGVAALWGAMWLTRATTPYALIADRYRWGQVEKACDAIVRHLPTVSALGRREVRSAIEAARWDLACLIRDQSRLADLQETTRRSAQGLAVRDPLHGELDLRQAMLAERLGTVQAEVEQRLGRLQSLATQSAAFATEDAQRRRSRAAVERARQALARADAGIAEAAAWDVRVDPAADFTERAEGVLAAYRELSDDPLTRSVEGAERRSSLPRRGYPEL